MEVPQEIFSSSLFFAVAFTDVIATIPAVIQLSLYVDNLAMFVSQTKLPCHERQLQLAIYKVMSDLIPRDFHILLRKQK